MGLLDKIKKWFTKKPDKKLKEANRISNYGGRGTSNSTAAEVRKSIAKAEKTAKQKQAATTSTSSSTKSSAFKSMPSGVRRAEQRDAKSTPATGTKSSAFKATPPKLNHHSTALGTLSTKEKNSLVSRRALAEADRTMREYKAAKLKPLIDAKYGGNTLESRQRIKSGEYQSDPIVAKYSVLKHPIAESAARGALSGTTFGLSDFAAAKLTKGEHREAEEFYQKNKNEFAEGVGTFAGAMLPYAGTAKAFENLGVKAVGRAAETRVGKRLGAEALAKAMAGNGAKSALARSLVGDAIQDSTLGLFDTAVGVARRDDLKTTSDYLKAIGRGQLANYGMGLAGNVVSNVAPALKSFNGGADRNISRVVADDLAARASRDANNVTYRINIRDMARKPEAPKVEVEPKIKAEANAELKADIKAAEPKAKAPKNEITVNGEQAKTGERTEFRRDNAETAKEQARKKRATNSREPATQESFDKDFSAFEKKINKAQELRNKIRSASGEEKDALQKQLDKLNDEIKSARNQASLRYHPDRGGSDEWMGKFNDTYKDYRRGSYSSKGFKSAESSTRAKTATGGGGNTTPPRRAKTATGDGNFKKPKGKATKKQRVVYDVEDIVGKKRQRKSKREQIKEFTGSVRTKISDSLSAFEDEARKKARTDHQGMLDDYGAIDKTRRYNAIAGKSIEEKQLKWSGDRYSGTIERNGHKIENGKSLKEIYDGMDEATERAFDKYLLLKHAPDRLREGKPIFDNTILIDGRSLNDPKVLVEEAEKILKQHPEFAQKAEEIYQYTRNELQNRVDAGLISQKVANEWNAKYPSYVPTGRDGDFSGFGGKNGNVGASDLKAAKGSDLDIRSIKEQLADATSRNWRDMSLNNMFRRMFGDRIGNELSTEVDGGLERVLDNTIGLSKSRDSRKHFAEVYIDGDMKRVEIEKRFYDAIEDLYKNGRLGNGLDVLTDAASKVATPFKNLITSFNPIFMVKNGLRDFSEAIINTRQTKEFLTSMPAAMKELITDGEYARALKDSGVSQANFVNLEEALVKDARGARKALNKFVALQDMVETYPRLVEYMATFKKAGVDLKSADMLLRDRAAANAADVTVNFGRSGSVGKMLNKGLVPFFNPSVQGWSKFVRNFSEQEGVKSTLGLLVKASALGAGATTLNNFLLEDNPNYQKISPREKATNYIIAFPPIKRDKDGTPHVNNDAELFIKIPRSRFAAAYGIPAVNIDNENKMGWAEMIKVAGDQVAPVDPIESNILAPFMAAQNNKTWYGAPIVSGELEDLPPSEQYDNNTSPLGKALGKATAKLPKELQISPKKADYVIDATTGVIGDFALPMSTAAAKGESALEAGKNVVKKAFTIDSVTQNNLSTRFYEKLNDADTNNKSAKGGETEKDEYDRMSAYSTEVSGINKAIKKLQNENLKMNQDSIRELQKVKNQYMQDAIDGKAVPSSANTMDVVQKHVGTTYAINNFGSSADKEAMEVYGASKYGDLSDAKMQKAIDADKDFYKGVKAIGKLEEKVAKSGVKSDTTLTKAVALASVGADDDLFGAYKCTKKSRTESADKMTKARDYIKNGGSEEEYVKLEKTRKTLGKLSDFDKEAELDGILKDLKSGKISEAEYYQKQGEIKYNANISYLGLATSLAQANSPSRGYKLYDIKDKNIQKGINLAAMGFTSRDYREMAKAVDTDGNGYPKKQEIIDFVSKSNVEDKATLYDALYYYKGKYNPFGAVTNYSRAQAADAGKAKGVEWITDERDDIEVNPEESNGGWRGGYYRYGRWHRWGGRGHGRGRAATMDKSAFEATPIKTSAEANAKSRVSSAGKQTYKSLAASLKTKSGSGGNISNNPRATYNTSAVKYQTAKAVKSAPKKQTTAKKTPPKVKFKKYEA